MRVRQAGRVDGCNDACFVQKQQAVGRILQRTIEVNIEHLFYRLFVSLSKLSTSASLPSLLDSVTAFLPSTSLTSHITRPPVHTRGIV
jgi:hypothetical protein